MNAQVKFVRRCAQGRGAERHLFGLKSLATSNGIPLPSLFKGKVRGRTLCGAVLGLGSWSGSWI